MKKRIFSLSLVLALLLSFVPLPIPVVAAAVGPIVLNGSLDGESGYVSEAVNAGWVPLSPSLSDPPNDQQTKKGQRTPGDIVGTPPYSPVYVWFGEDEIAFRVRVNGIDGNFESNASRPMEFSDAVWIGMDMTLNGRIDFFIVLYNPTHAQQGRLSVFSALPNALNDGPSTSGLSTHPVWTTGTVSAQSNPAAGNYSLNQVDSETFTQGEFSQGHDYYISFKASYVNINTAIVEMNKSRATPLDFFSGSTVFRAVVGTSTQENSLNQDVCGMVGIEGKQTWAQAGLFSPPMTQSGFEATPYNVMFVIDEDDYNGKEEDYYKDNLFYDIKVVSKNGGGIRRIEDKPKNPNANLRYDVIPPGIVFIKWYYRAEAYGAGQDKKPLNLDNLSAVPSEAIDRHGNLVAFAEWGIPGEYSEELAAPTDTSAGEFVFFYYNYNSEAEENYDAPTKAEPKIQDYFYYVKVEEKETIGWAANPPAPVGYKFGGWFDNRAGTGGAYASDMTYDETQFLYAKWEVDTPLVNIGFVENGGAFDNPDAAEKVEVTNGLFPDNYETGPDTPKPGGYKFIGWNTEPDGSGEWFEHGDPLDSGYFGESDHHLNVYAIWDRDITVIFDSNGGKFMEWHAEDGEYVEITGGKYADGEYKTVSTERELAGGGYGILPHGYPMRNAGGYTFSGWKLGDTVFGPDAAQSDIMDAIKAATGDTITLYAQWTLPPPPPPVDTTPPTGEIKIRTNSFTNFLNTVTFGLFFKNTAGVTITASDDSGGPVTIQYALVETKFDSEAAAKAYTGWESYPPAGFSMNPGDKYIVYAKLTDEAGNVTVINSQGAVVFEDSDPSAGKDYIRGSADLEVPVEMRGNTVKSVSHNGEALTEGTHYTVDENKVIFKKAYLESFADGNEAFTVSYYPQGVTTVPLPGGDTIGTTLITVTIITPTYTVTGKVVDEDDNPIEDAKVELNKGDDQKYFTETDENGEFSITGVYEDTYDLVVTGPGGFPIRSRRVNVTHDMDFSNPPIVLHGILSTMINIDGDLPITTGDLDAMLNINWLNNQQGGGDDTMITLADIMWVEVDAGALRLALYAQSFNEEETEKEEAVAELKELAAADNNRVVLWLNLWVNKYLFENVDDYLNASQVYNNSPNYKESGYDENIIGGIVEDGWNWATLTLLPNLINIYIPLDGTELSGEPNLAVYRRHKGIPEILPRGAAGGEEYFIHDVDDNSITLFVKRFSEYAIAKPADGGLPQTIAVANPGAKTFGDPPFNLSLANPGSGTGAVTYMLDPGFTGTQAGTVSPAGEITITGAGEIRVIAIKAACDTYGGAVSPPITITVSKASGAAVDSPKTESISDDSITVFPVTPPYSGQAVEYAISPAKTPPALGWQTGLTFSHLTPETEYTIFARAAENVNYYAGAAAYLTETTLSAGTPPVMPGPTPMPEPLPEPEGDLPADPGDDSVSGPADDSPPERPSPEPMPTPIGSDGTEPGGTGPNPKTGGRGVAVWLWLGVTAALLTGVTAVRLRRK